MQEEITHLAPCKRVLQSITCSAAHFGNIRLCTPNYAHSRTSLCQSKDTASSTVNVRGSILGSVQNVRRGSGKCTVLDSVWCFSRMTDPNNHWQLHVQQPVEAGKRAQWKKHDVHALKNTERRQVANQKVLNALTASVFSPDAGRETLGLELDKWVENSAIANVAKEFKKHLKNLKKLRQELASQDQPESAVQFHQLKHGDEHTGAFVTSKSFFEQSSSSVPKTKDKTTPGKDAPSQSDLNLQGDLPEGITIEECEKNVKEGDNAKVKLGAEMEAFVDKIFLGTCELKLDQLVGPERGKTASRKLRQGEVRKIRDSMMRNRSVHIVLGALVRPSAPVCKEKQTSLKRSRVELKQFVSENTLQVQDGIWAEVIDGNHRRVALQELLAICNSKRHRKVTCNVFCTDDPEDNKMIRKHGHLVNEADKISIKSAVWDAIAEMKTSYLEAKAFDARLGPTRFTKEHIGDWKELTSSHSKGGCGATCLNLVVGLAQWSEHSWNLLEKFCNPGPNDVHDAPKDFKWISKVRGMDEKDCTTEIKKVMSLKDHTIKQMIVSPQKKQWSKHLTSLFMKKHDVSSWEASHEKFQVPKNDKWLSFAIQFHLVKNKMAPEKNKRVIPEVALNSFQNCVDQCKATRAMEDAERIQLKEDAIELNIVTGVVVKKLGIVMQNKGKSTNHVFVDTLVGAFDIGQSFDDKQLNIYVNKIHAGKQLDFDRHVTGDFTLTIRCLPENSDSFSELINKCGHDDVDVLHACEHDRRPQKPKTSFAPMIDAHIIAKNGSCAQVDFGKRENLIVTSSPKSITVDGKLFAVDRKGDVMEHLCLTLHEERSAVLIAHGGQGFDACALLHFTHNCIQLNRHQEITNRTKAKVHSMTTTEDPSSQKALFETKFNSILTKCSALQSFGKHWHDLGRMEGKKLAGGSDDEETSLVDVVKKSVSAAKGKGEKRPHTLRARVSPAKKAKTAKTVGKSMKRRTSDPPQCGFCKRPVLPNELGRCAECDEVGHKDCLAHKSIKFKLRFCSEDCKNAYEQIAHAAAKL
eukprot:jgi/Bigna1/84636/fgenesh1_pg.186_\